MWPLPGLQAPALRKWNREAKRCAQGKLPVWGGRAGEASEALAMEMEGRLSGRFTVHLLPVTPDERTPTEGGVGTTLSQTEGRPSPLRGEGIAPRVHSW